MTLDNIFSFYKTKQFTKALEAIKKTEVKSSQLYNLEGMIYHKLKQINNSITSFKKSIQLNKTFLEPRVNLGILYYQNNKLDLSYNELLNCNKIDANNAIVNFYLGRLKIQRFNDLEESEVYYLKSILLSNNTMFINELALLYFKKSRFKDAIFFFNKSLVLKFQKELLFYISKSYVSLNMINKSFDFLEKILVQDPLNTEALFLKAMNFLYTGKQSEGRDLLKKILTIDDNHSKSYFELSKIDKNYCTKNKRKILENYRLSKNNFQKADYGFALYNTLDYQNNFSEASEYLIKANRSVYESIKLNQYNDEEEFKVYKNIFNSKKITININNEKNYVKTPIFIVGMPRSGSTLIEHILSYFNDIEALGEVDYFYKSIEYCFKDLTLENLEKKLSNGLSKEQIQIISNYYLKLIDSKKFFFTDKMLSNFRFIGFIIQCFPNAKILFCKRDKLQNCFSIYANHFGSVPLPWRYDQNLIKKQYELHLDLMTYWIKNFNHNIFEINHEHFIKSPKSISKKIVEFIGLNWDEKCLNFNSDRSLIKTASVNQVRVGINNKASDEHLIYKKYLPDLFS